MLKRHRSPTGKKFDGQMSLKIEAKLHAAIARVAQARGCSVSQFIREAALKALDGHRREHAAA
jgi:predicted HicB family RNase H-like nuclease